MFREVTRLTPGTQVVLRAGVRPSLDGTPRKPGFFGEVTQVVEDAEESYVVRFSDGAVFTLPRRHLVVRRTLMTAELDMLAPDQITWSDYVCYRVRVGAHAYGLDEGEAEDDAVRGVYVPPAELHWSLYKPQDMVEPSRLTAEDGHAPPDEVLWEVEKFIRLGLAANPAVLETLYTPAVVAITDVGRELRTIRDAFLSKLIMTTFIGYAMSQFKKMLRGKERGEEPRPRHAMHLVRLLLSGLHAAQTCEMDVTVPAHHTELVAIRTGRMAFDEAYAWAIALQRQFEATIPASALPDLPDYATVNEFLVRARAQGVHVSVSQSHKP
jgi:predicted nucleotidyltransferase